MQFFWDPENFTAGPPFSLGTPCLGSKVIEEMASCPQPPGRPETQPWLDPPHLHLMLIQDIKGLLPW